MSRSFNHFTIVSLLILAVILAACDIVKLPGSAPTPLPSTLLPTFSPQASDSRSASGPDASLPTVTRLPDVGGVTWSLVASGLDQPTQLTHAGDGSGRIFVLERPGAIRIIENGQVRRQPFLDIGDRVGHSASEQGLLGIAFHPRYTENGYFYVNYTDRAGDTVIARFRASADPNLADPGTEIRLLTVVQPYANHNGGSVNFGPDGYLYLGLGDGGAAYDPDSNAQNLDSLLGALLRIDVDRTEGEKAYAIPTHNPFANGEGRPEIWAYGLRNPWRFSFDARTGDLYIADVGQSSWEEIDFLPAGHAGGANFGWDYREGAHSLNGPPPESLTFTDPVAEYGRGGGCSVTGGHVYRGSALPDWVGVYLYGDFCSGKVWGLLRLENGGWANSQLFDLEANISSFGVDERGELYLVDFSGRIFRLTQN